MTVYRELEETRHFEWMDLNTDEEEHSIEMQLPFIAKVMEGYVYYYIYYIYIITIIFSFIINFCFKFYINIGLKILSQ